MRFRPEKTMSIRKVGRAITAVRTSILACPAIERFEKRI
jgi:hypothetical protein